MEKIQECAGNLLAELYDARFEFEHGRMNKEVYLARIETLRGMARNVRSRHCKPRPQPTLHFEAKHEIQQPNQERHEVWAASYL
jgi:hypothetical protein